jgi:C-terminal processing protease CtpA/Prc
LIGTLIGSSLTLLFIPKQIQESGIPPKLLKEDVDFLLRSIEEIHPNPYAYTPKEDIYKMKMNIIKQIDHPMTQFEFYKKIAPLVASLKDGHTSVRLPKIPGKLFPLKVEIFGNRIFAGKEYGGIPQGSEILEINEIKASELIEGMKKYMSGERDAFISAVIEREFPQLLYAELGDCKEFKVNLRSPEGEIKECSLEAEEKTFSTTFMEFFLKGPYSFEIINKDTALMTFDEFIYPDTFEVFLEGMFKQIKEKSIKNLIIDLRKNGGGSSTLGDMLLEYLTDKPFRQYSKIDVKMSMQFVERDIGIERISEIPTNKIPKPYREHINKLLKDEFGFIIEWEQEFIKPERNPLRFEGNVYVLTSRYTFSSATDFAATIKDHEIGKIIGEETGGWPTCYGDVICFTLPNSKISVGCSFKYFVRPSGEDTRAGVIPDYIVEPQPEDLITGKDRVMEFTLNLIEWKKWK